MSVESVCIEYINTPNTPTPSVRLTTIFIRDCGKGVYNRVEKREEIPQSVVTTNLWNVRVVNRDASGCSILTFDGLPGEQIIFYFTSTLGAISIVCTEATSTQSVTDTQTVPVRRTEEVTDFYHGNFHFLKKTEITTQL